MCGIFTYIGIIFEITLGVNVGQYSSTMDSLGYIYISIWVNYNDLTTSSLESWLIREIIPKWPNYSG